VEADLAAALHAHAGVAPADWRAYGRVAGLAADKFGLALAPPALPPRSLSLGARPAPARGRMKGLVGVMCAGPQLLSKPSTLACDCEAGAFGAPDNYPELPLVTPPPRANEGHLAAGLAQQRLSSARQVRRAQAARPAMRAAACGGAAVRARVLRPAL